MASFSSKDEVDPFSCTICLESMIDRSPRLLPCGHTYCQSCLEGMLHTGGEISCPHACTTGTVAKLEELPHHPDIERYHDFCVRVASNASDKQDERCYNCHKLGKLKPSKVKCVQCCRSFCTSCKEKRNFVKAMEDHELVSIVDTEKQFCHRHGLLLEYVCISCDTGLCLDCTFEEVHQEHARDIETIESGINIMQQRIPSYHQDINDLCNRIDRALTRLQSESEFSKDALRKMQQTIIAKQNKEATNSESVIHSMRRQCMEQQNREQLNLKYVIQKLHVVSEELENLLLMEPHELLYCIANVKVRTEVYVRMAMEILYSTYPCPRVQFPDMDERKFYGLMEMSFKEYSPVEGLDENANETEATEQNEEEGNILEEMLQLDQNKLSWLQSPAKIVPFKDWFIYIDSNNEYVSIISMEGKQAAKFYPLTAGRIVDAALFGCDLYIGQRSAVSIIPMSSAGDTRLVKLKEHTMAAFAVYSAEDLVTIETDSCAICLFHMSLEGREEEEGYVVVNGLHEPVGIDVAFTVYGTKCLVAENKPLVLKIYNDNWDLEHSVCGPESDVISPVAYCLTEANDILIADNSRKMLCLSGLEGNSHGHFPVGADIARILCIAFYPPLLWLIYENKARSLELKAYCVYIQ